MSELPATTDIAPTSRKVAEVPKADSCSAANRLLFDDLTGGSEERRRNVETACLNGREIDGKIELGRLLDRNFARIRFA